MTALSQALSAALLHFIWEGAAVAFLLWAALFLLRRRTANARYAVSCAAMGIMAGLPAATLWILYRRPASIGAPIAFLLAPAAKAFAASASSREWLPVIREWILPAWAIGVSLFAVRLAFAWRHVARLRGAAVAAENPLAELAGALARRMGVMRPVRVLTSALAEAPSVIGWLKPAILVPAAALAGLDAAQLESILAHELAHVRRHDYLVNVLQTVVETLLFYHPAVWWVSSRMRQERELCCDDLAVRYCGDAIGYARALTRLARIRAVPQPAVAANGGSLLYRIQRLTGTIQECGPSRLPALLALIAAALCVPLAMHRAQAAPQQPAGAANVDFGTPARAGSMAGQNGIPRDSIPMDYPAAAIEKGVTGSVVVDATLDQNGHAVDAYVLTGPLELRKAALRGVLDGHFGNATAGEVRRVTIDFGPKELAAARVRKAEADAVKARLAHANEQAQQTNARSDALDERQRQANMTMGLFNAELKQAQQKLAAFAHRQENEDQLKAQLAELQGRLTAVRLEAMAQQNVAAEWQRKTEEANPTVGAADSDMKRAMKSQILILREQLSQASQTYGPRSPQIEALEAHLASAEQTLSNVVAGRKLARIDVTPGPDESFHLDALPVKIGDILTQDSINATIAAANRLNYDVAFFPIGKEAGIRIVKRQ